jgi:hypothetical protein
MSSGAPFLLVITVDGYGKRVALDDIPLRRRTAKGVKLSTAPVAAAMLVGERDSLLIASARGKIVRVGAGHADALRERWLQPLRSEPLRARLASLTRATVPRRFLRAAADTPSEGAGQERCACIREGPDHGRQTEPVIAVQGATAGGRISPLRSRYRPAMLHISHHERVDGHPYRWHVFLHGRDQPIPVELDPEERRSLKQTDEEIHDLLPTALERHHTENRDEVLSGEEYQDATWDAPVRVFQTHFNN